MDIHLYRGFSTMLEKEQFNIRLLLPTLVNQGIISPDESTLIINRIQSSSINLLQFNKTAAIFIPQPENSPVQKSARPILGDSSTNNTISCLPYDIHQNPYYSNFTTPKGHALIINNSKFTNGIRIGAQSDFNHMFNLWQSLGYSVECKNDRTASQMGKDIKNFVSRFKKIQSFDSCVVVIMTHGHCGQFLGVDGKGIKEEFVFETVMKSKALKGKPKIFIIQASRGSEMATDTWKPEVLRQVKEAEEKSRVEFKEHIPRHQDSYVLYSTTPNYQEDGSLFIQAVSTEFSKYAHESWADLTTLGLLVKNNVNDRLSDQQKRCLGLPEQHFTLLKKFHFFPGVKQV